MQENVPYVILILLYLPKSNPFSQHSESYNFVEIFFGILDGLHYEGMAIINLYFGSYLRDFLVHFCCK